MQFPTPSSIVRVAYSNAHDQTYQSGNDHIEINGGR